MRTGLAGHIHSALFCVSYYADALLCRYMTDMIGTARFISEFEIALYLARFRFRAYASVAVLCRVLPIMYVSAFEQAVHLAVSCDDLAERLRLQHRLSHHVIRLHAVPVIRKSDAAICHTCQVCKLFTLLSDRDGRVRVYVDAGIPVDDILLHFQVLRRIGDRGEIRHRADGRVTSAGCRLRARSYRFFI